MGEREEIDEYEAELEAEIERNPTREGADEAEGTKRRIEKALDKAGFLLY